MSHLPAHLASFQLPSGPATMTAHWSDLEPMIIVWSVVGVFVLVFGVCCLLPRRSIGITTEAPVVHPPTNPPAMNIELGPLPRAFIPAPLYEDRHRDLWLPDSAELEKHDDGYYYPKNLEP